MVIRFYLYSFVKGEVSNETLEGVPVTVEESIKEESAEEILAPIETVKEAPAEEILAPIETKDPKEPNSSDAMETEESKETEVTKKE